MLSQDPEPATAAGIIFDDILAKSNAKPLTQADIVRGGLIQYVFEGGPADGSTLWCSPDSKGDAGCMSPCGEESPAVALHTYKICHATRTFQYSGVEGFLRKIGGGK